MAGGEDAGGLTHDHNHDATTAAKTRRQSGSRQNDTLQTVLQQSGIEVDQETDAEASSPSDTQRPDSVHDVESLNRLQLDDDQPLHDEVDSVRSQQLASVRHLNGLLAFEGKTLEPAVSTHIAFR